MVQLYHDSTYFLFIYYQFFFFFFLGGGGKGGGGKGGGELYHSRSITSSIVLIKLYTLDLSPYVSIDTYTAPL